jgi:PadR family transcriptional regulator PadR
MAAQHTTGAAFRTIGPGRVRPMDIPKETCYSPLRMPKDRSEVLQGTLDLMVLKTLDALGPLHGYGVARRIEQLSDDLLRLNEGTVYAALLRLLQKGWIRSQWGASDSNRKAKFYSITPAGRKQLARETKSWERISSVIGRVLRLASQR